MDQELTDESNPLRHNEGCRAKCLMQLNLLRSVNPLAHSGEGPRGHVEAGFLKIVLDIVPVLCSYAARDIALRKPNAYAERG